MEKYIVAIAENDFKREGFSNELAIVSANSENEAINAFITNFINTDGGDFIDEFFNTEHFINGLFNYDTGTNKYSEEKTIEIIKNRIRKFFKGTDYADIYMKEYLKEEGKEKLILSFDLMVYFILNTNYLGDILVSNIKDVEIN